MGGKAYLPLYLASRSIHTDNSALNRSERNSFQIIGVGARRHLPLSALLPTALVTE